MRTRKPLPRWKRTLRESWWTIKALVLLLWGLLNVLLWPCLLASAIYRLLKGW